MCLDFEKKSVIKFYSSLLFLCKFVDQLVKNIKILFELVCKINNLILYE